MTSYNPDRANAIEEMFSSIAQNYDKANTWLSMGMSRLWSQRLTKEVIRHQNVSTLVDLCAGTGDITKTFLNKMPLSTAFLVDISKPMLDIAKKKLQGHSAQFIVGNVLSTPLKDGIADAITIAYGIRNLPHLTHFYGECFRLLKPDGLLAILELTRPKNPFLKVLHRHYLEKMVPFIGKSIAGNGSAYEYLCNSIKNFASPKEITLQLTSTGFVNIKMISLMGGVATIFLARRKIR